MYKTNSKDKVRKSMHSTESKIQNSVNRIMKRTIKRSTCMLIIDYYISNINLFFILRFMIKQSQWYVLAFELYIFVSFLLMNLNEKYQELMYYLSLASYIQFDIICYISIQLGFHNMKSWLSNVFYFIYEVYLINTYQYTSLDRSTLIIVIYIYIYIYPIYFDLIDHLYFSCLWHRLINITWKKIEEKKEQGTEEDEKRYEKKKKKKKQIQSKKCQD